MLVLCSAASIHRVTGNEASRKLMEEAAPPIEATPPRPLDALQKLRDATKADPKDALAWYMRGGYALTLYLAKESLDSLDKAAALDPKLASVQFLRGRALQELGRQGPALAAFDRETNRDRNPLYYFYRALAEKAARKYPAALANFDRSDSAYEAGRQATHLHRGDILAAQGKRDAAIRAYEQVRSIDPTQPIVGTADDRLKAVRTSGRSRR